MGGFQLNEPWMIGFALTFLRVSGFIFAWPFGTLIPTPLPLKILLSLSITLAVHAGSHSTNTPPTAELALIAAATTEVVIGVLIGFVGRMVMFFMEMGGNLVAHAMGLASASMFNPSTASSTSVIEIFHIMFGGVVLLMLNVHHALIGQLVESLTIIPVGAAMNIPGPEIAQAFIEGVFVAAIKISAPVVVVVFVINIAMGIISRAVPQLNILVTSLPVNIMAGLIVMILAAPALFRETGHESLEVLDAISHFIKVLGSE